MLFSIDYDLGASLSFYLVPDTGGTTPSVRIFNDGAEITVMPANELRPELIGAGRHSSGMCGFFLDDEVLPGIAAMRSLDIVEAETGLQI